VPPVSNGVFIPMAGVNGMAVYPRDRKPMLEKNNPGLMGGKGAGREKPKSYNLTKVNIENGIAGVFEDFRGSLREEICSHCTLKIF